MFYPCSSLDRPVPPPARQSISSAKRRLVMLCLPSLVLLKYVIHDAFKKMLKNVGTEDSLDTYRLMWNRFSIEPWNITTLLALSYNWGIVGRYISSIREFGKAAQKLLNSPRHFTFCWCHRRQLMILARPPKEKYCCGDSRINFLTMLFLFIINKLLHVTLCQSFFWTLWRCSRGFEVDRTGDAHDFGFFFYLVYLLFPVVGLTNRKFQQVESVSRIQIWVAIMAIHTFTVSVLRLLSIFASRKTLFPPPYL